MCWPEKRPQASFLVKIDRELHSALKAECARRKISLKSAIESAIADLLKPKSSPSPKE
jgi:predicted HicB family RNase H-like nuclease